MRWSLSVCILVEAHLGFLCIGVLVGGSYHFTDTSRWLTVEFGAKLAMVESSDKGGDDFSFHDVGDRVPHLGETLDVAVKELGWLLVDAAKIMLRAGVSSRGADGSGISLQPLSWVHSSFIGLDPGDLKATGPSEHSKILCESRRPLRIVDTIICGIVVEDRLEG